jgi:hypothetical protein
MTKRERGPDPIVDSDRGRGTTPPEQGPESADVTGRPAVERPRTAFHQPAESTEDEREPLSETEALEEGGSFDGIAPPQELDQPPA